MKLKRAFPVLLIVFLLSLSLSSTKAQENGSIQVMAAWAGDEETGFREVLTAFTEATGIEVVYVVDRDVQDTVQTLVAGGNPPDVAAIPRPGVIAQLARDGALVPLTDLLDEAYLHDNYSDAILALGTVDGTLYGIMGKANSKSTIWYRPADFEELGVEVPTTWDELIAVQDAFLAAGKTPWSIGGLDGWTLTDWFENIYSRVADDASYLGLFVTHDVAWTDDSVKEAMSYFEQIVAPSDENLVGGADGTLSTGFQDAYYFLLRGEAGLHYEGGFMSSFGEQTFPDLECGEDYTFFLFPPISEEMGAPVIGGGDIFVAFNDRPEVAAFIEFLASAEAGSTWATAEAGSVISPNKNVSLDLYEAACKRAEAEQIVGASRFLFDGSDLAPGAVGGDAMFTGLQDFIADPASVDDTLQFLEDVAAEAY